MSFCTNTIVRGGASKLMVRAKILAKELNYDGLLSYAELRFGSGNVYAKCGFEKLGESKINYWYTDGQKRLDRFKFRATPEKSENLIAEEAGVCQIYGAGNAIFAFRF